MAACCKVVMSSEKTGEMVICSSGYKGLPCVSSLDFAVVKMEIAQVTHSWLKWDLVFINQETACVF